MGDGPSALIDKGQLAGPSATGPTGPETSAPAFLFSHQAPYRCKGWTLIQPLTRYGHPDEKIQRGEATIGYDNYRTKYVSKHARPSVAVLEKVLLE